MCSYNPCSWHGLWRPLCEFISFLAADLLSVDARKVLETYRRLWIQFARILLMTRTVFHEIWSKAATALLSLCVCRWVSFGKHVFLLAYSALLAALWHCTLLIIIKETEAMIVAKSNGEWFHASFQRFLAQSGREEPTDAEMDALLQEYVTMANEEPLLLASMA